jgi:hypothetical protein
MGTPFFSNLGVTDIQQARSPTVDAFPTAFNPNSRSEWEAAVHEVVPKDPVADWVFAIQRYVDLCEQHGVYPFQSTQQSRNDRISDYLRDRRRAFVKFTDKTQFFENAKIRTTERNIVVTNSGFVLTVIAHANVTDPSFEKWLSTMPFPRFDVIHDGKYWKTLYPGLRMFVYRDHGSNSSERWVIGYEITCEIFPDLPDQHLPTKQQIEHFILELLWMPHLRAIRPKKMLHRLV